LATSSFDVLLLDLSLPDSEGLATIQRARVMARGIPIVVLSGRGDTDFALTALEAGALDYMVKGDFGYDGLGRVVRYALLRTEMEARNNLLIAALEAAANGIVITDKEATVIWTNPAFSQLTGYSPEEALGNKTSELSKSGLHDKAFYQAMWAELLDGQHWRGELINKRKNGSLYHEELNIAPVKKRRRAKLLILSGLKKIFPIVRKWKLNCKNLPAAIR
jgi:PAS domain S-box